jgi:hypothetical protein
MVNRQAIQEDTRFADIRRDVTQFVRCVTLSARIADALKPLSATGCTPRGVRRCQKWRVIKRYAQANALPRTALSPTKKLTHLHAIGASVAVSPT